MTRVFCSCNAFVQAAGLSFLFSLVAVLSSAAVRAADAPVVPPKEGKSETIQLFNGKDSQGWQGHKKYWSVEDGVIVGKNTEAGAREHLPGHGRKYTDFRLLATVKLVSPKCTRASPCGAASRRSKTTSTPMPACW